MVEICNKLKNGILMTDNKFVQLGFIRGAHGLRGNVVVHVFSGDRQSLTVYGPLCSADGKKSYKFKVTGEKQGDFLCTLENVTDRNQAEDLKGTKLYVPASTLPEPDEDDFYIKDLIGLKVIDAKNTHLGEVINVTSFGPHDALEIRFVHDGSVSLETPQSEYILFTRDNVPLVDIKTKTVTVNIPDGLFQQPAEEK